MYCSFDKHLYRHLPILEPCTSVHALYNSSTLLFWTILLVTCGGPRNAKYGSYYRAILPYQQEMLASNFLGPPSVQVLQAMLLLCVWPVPIRAQHDDPCWTICGMAVNMAMQMGFHQPHHTEEYFRPFDKIPATIEIRCRIWLVCFQLSTRYVDFIIYSQDSSERLRHSLTEAAANSH